MRPFLVLFLLLVAITLPAQDFSKSVKIMGLYGSTPYLNEFAPGGGLHVDFLLREKTSLSIGAGILGHTVTTKGTYSGTSNGVFWENKFRYFQNESFRYFEAAVLWNPFSSKNKNHLKIGVGAALTKTIFQYASNIDFNIYILESIEYVEQSKSIIMPIFIAEDELNLTKRISIFGRGTFRIPIITQAYVEQNIRYKGIIVAKSSSGIKYNLTFALGLGYKF